MSNTAQARFSEEEILRAFFAMEERVANRASEVLTDDDMDLEDDLPTVVDAHLMRRVEHQEALETVPPPMRSASVEVVAPPVHAVRPPRPGRAAPRLEIVDLRVAPTPTLWDRFTAWLSRWTGW
jgi:hypothetical protein